MRARNFLTSYLSISLIILLSKSYYLFKKIKKSYLVKGIFPKEQIKDNESRYLHLLLTFVLSSFVIQNKLKHTYICMNMHTHKETLIEFLIPIFTSVVVTVLSSRNSVMPVSSKR